MQALQHGVLSAQHPRKHQAPNQSWQAPRTQRTHQPALRTQCALLYTKSCLDAPIQGENEDSVECLILRSHASMLTDCSYADTVLVRQYYYPNRVATESPGSTVEQLPLPPGDMGAPLVGSTLEWVNNYPAFYERRCVCVGKASGHKVERPAFAVNVLLPAEVLAIFETRGLILTEDSMWSGLTAEACAGEPGTFQSGWPVL